MKEGIKCWHKGEKINWYQKVHVYQLKCLGTPQKQTQGYKHCPGLGTWEEIQENELLCRVLDSVCVPLRSQGWSCWSILGAAVKDLGSGLLLVTVGIHSRGITQELLKAEKKPTCGLFWTAVWVSGIFISWYFLLSRKVKELLWGFLRQKAAEFSGLQELGLEERTRSCRTPD